MHLLPSNTIQTERWNKPLPITIIMKQCALVLITSPDISCSWRQLKRRSIANHLLKCHSSQQFETNRSLNLISKKNHPIQGSWNTKIYTNYFVKSIAILWSLEGNSRVSKKGPYFFTFKEQSWVLKHRKKILLWQKSAVEVGRIHSLCVPVLTFLMQHLHFNWKENGALDLKNVKCGFYITKRQK